MKIHFIYPHINTYMYPDVHHGLASIFAVLKSRGHLVSLQYVTKMPTKRGVLEVIHKENPDLIAFSSVTNQIRYVDLYSRWIKEEFDIPTICGGIHATIYPEEITGFSGIDMVCQGEGEYPLLELAEDLERDDIRNIRFKKNGMIVINPLRPPISNLDELPFPDYRSFNPDTILKARHGDFSVMASRGCPFSCTYCCNHAIRSVQAGKGKYFRVRSVDNFLEHLRQLTNQYPIRHLTFSDDVFGISREWVREFCEKYPRSFDIEFECNTRVETVDEGLLQELKRAHCTQIDMGIEVGNEWLRKEILKRQMTNAQIINAFETAQRVGIKTFSYNMVGLPYETPEMVRETIELNKRVEPDQIAITVFYPYPGTELYELCKKEGYLGEKQSSSYMTESVLELPTITKKELEKLYTEFYLYAIDRRIRWYPTLLRFSIMSAVSVFAKIFGKRAIEILLKAYAPFLRIISLLEVKRYSTN